MSFQLIFQAAIQETLLEYDLSNQLIHHILNNSTLIDQATFIYHQLQTRLDHIIRHYQNNQLYTNNISQTQSRKEKETTPHMRGESTLQHMRPQVMGSQNASPPTQDLCGYIVKSYQNKYKLFCNLPSHLHNNNQVDTKLGDVSHPTMHNFQHKNINNINDQIYQDNLLIIQNFIHNITANIISKIIILYLTDHATPIHIPYQNTQKLRIYDTLLLNQPQNYFRYNLLKNDTVTFFHLQGGTCHQL